MYLECMPVSLSFIKHMKNKYDQLLKENNIEKIKHEETKEELDKYKKELKQAENEINQSKIENILKTQAVLVGGSDANFALGEKPNNISKNGHPIISPPVKSHLNPTSLLSFSSYSYHSVAVTRGWVLETTKIKESLPLFQKVSLITSLNLGTNSFLFQRFAV